MKPENVIAASGASRSSLAADKKHERKLQLTLEAGYPGSAVVLHCQGRLISHGEARALSTIVADVLPASRRMVLDLAGVESIDSGGLGELVLIHMWAEAAGYTLRFASHRKSLRHLFEITNLVSVFDLHGSVPEAVAAMVQEEVHTA
jgi:anti-anti-sigma factor